MLVHLGPVETKQMDGWLRFARRVLCDLRTEPGDMDSQSGQSLLADWCQLIDQWHDVVKGGTSSGQGGQFVWQGQLESDKAEYLLHSLQRTLHSATVAAWVTPDDVRAHGMITFHIMQRFIDTLESEGTAHGQYVEQLRAEATRFGASLA